MARRGRLGAVLTASALLLCGCGDPVSAPPGVSEAELDAAVQRVLDDIWAEKRLPEGTVRPTVERVRFIAEDEWAEVMLACLNEAGLTDYRIQGDGDIASTANTSVVAPEVPIIWYVCAAEYPVNPIGGVLDREQREYLYRYYQTRLVPCLTEYGLTVTDQPGEEEFVESERQYFLWNPYTSWSVRKKSVDPMLPLRCPPAPPGFLPDEYVGDMVTAIRNR